MTSAQTLSFSSRSTTCQATWAEPDEIARQIVGNGLTLAGCGSTKCTDQSEELSLTHDANFLPVLDKLFGLPMLAAYFLPVQQIQILIPDNQKSDLFGNASFYRYSCASSQCARFSSTQGQLPCEAGYVPKQGSVLVTFDRFGLLVVVSFSRLFRAELLETFPGLLFCKQNHLRRSLGIFYRVVMIKLEAKYLFQVGEAVASVSFQFGPSPSRHYHAVMPSGAYDWKAVPLASTIDCAFVKAAVLNNWVSLHEAPERVNRIWKTWCVGHTSLINAMQIDIEGIKVGFRIDQGAEAESAPLIVENRETKLANAGRVAVGCFHVDGNKPVPGFQDLLSSWYKRWRRGIRGCAKVLISCAKEAFKKIHSNWPSILSVQIPDSLNTSIARLNNQSEMEACCA